MITSRRAIAVLLVTFWLAACADLRAVNHWAGSAVDATGFNQVVTTYTDTPNRLSRYNAGNEDFFKSEADRRARQARTLQEMLGVVQDYMAALAAISADDPVRFNEEITRTTDSLKALEIADEATLNAVGKIVSVLASEAIQVWRAREAAELIDAANQPIQALLSPEGQLYRIVDQDFRSDLLTERISMQIYYEARLREEGASLAAKAAIEEWRDLRLAELDRRLEAIDGYTMVLVSLAAGHQELFDNRHALGGEALAQRLFGLSNDLKQDVRKLIRGG